MKVYLSIKTVLNQEIICIAWAVENQPPQVIHRTQKISERKLLQNFFKQIYQQVQQPTVVWVGYRIHFIIRFLFQRAVILKILPNVNLPLSNKLGSSQLFDPSKMWTGKSNTLSLSELCKILRIRYSALNRYAEAINEIQALEFPSTKNLTTLISLCQENVRCCREAYKRISFNECLH